MADGSTRFGSGISHNLSKKKQILQERYHIAMTKKMTEEVTQMGGLGWGIFEEGFVDGFKIGFKDSFVEEFQRAYLEVLREDVDEDAKQKVRELAEQRCQKTTLLSAIPCIRLIQFRKKCGLICSCANSSSICFSLSSFS